MKREHDSGSSSTQRKALRHTNLSAKASIPRDGPPFAEGTFRNVYKGTYTEGPQLGEACVGKRFKTGGVFEDRFFAEDVVAVSRAKQIIRAFNQAGMINKTIYMNEATVWACEQPDAAGRNEKLLVEARALPCCRSLL